VDETSTQAGQIVRFILESTSKQDKITSCIKKEAPINPMWTLLNKVIVIS
jgi:hypothetical protein